MRGSTCTTRHGQGYRDVPEAFRGSFLAIEPGAYIGDRPTIDLADDVERVFQGKSLVFLEVPVVAYPRFFAGYIGSTTPESRELISQEFYAWQVQRVRHSIASCRVDVLAVISCVYAQYHGYTGHGIGEAAKCAQHCIADREVLSLPNNHSGLAAVIRQYITSPDGTYPDVEKLSACEYQPWQEALQSPIDRETNASCQQWMQ